MEVLLYERSSIEERAIALAQYIIVGADGSVHPILVNLIKKGRILMTDEEYEKKVKGTKTFCIIIGILFSITLLVALAQRKIIVIIMSLAYIILLYLFYSLTKKKKIAGPIIGIILGCMYILELKILAIIIGIFILIDCIAMLKYIKGTSK